MQALASEVLTNICLPPISEIFRTEPALPCGQQGHKILKAPLLLTETGSCASTAPCLNLNQVLNMEVADDISAFEFILHVVAMLSDTDTELSKLRNVLKSLEQQNKMKSKEIW